MKALITLITVAIATLANAQLNKEVSMLANTELATSNLQNITAEQNPEGYIKITWTLSAQPDERQLVIEKSVDGLHYITVGKMPTVAAPGKITYSCRDIHPALGNNMYRVKSVSVYGEEFIYQEQASIVVGSSSTPVAQEPNGQ